MEKKDEIQQLKSQLAASKKEVKSFHSKLKRSQDKVAKQKVVLKKRDKDYRSERRTATITLEPIARHRYKELVVRLGTQLYSRINCCFRAVVDILKIINEAFDGILGGIPSRNTIENWVKKCGLDIYNSPKNSRELDKYAMVVDESMVIGSEKLLLRLGVPAQHKEAPLSAQDVSILDIAVSSSWNSERLKSRLSACVEKIGHRHEYVISDNASVMTRGITLTKLPAHHDISHSLGMFLERCYKNEEDFIAYTKSMSDAQFKHNMKKTAYLLPPRQRTIARFINLSNWINWSRKMLYIYHNLTLQERTAFAFVPANASLIDEFTEVMECINRIENNCKQNGLSKDTIKQCLKDVKSILLAGNSRMKTIGDAICRFLLKEGEVLENEKSVHNNSSDVIESTFGVYKLRKSPNKLYGVISFILFLPV